MEPSDLVITGGGIVGLATALRLQSLHPGASILVLEKEAAVAQHQSGRNSGVIHAGVYYAPGSLKARFCARGVVATRDFCDEHAIPYRLCGKLIVATDEDELDPMTALEKRARTNGIVIERLSGEEARRLEPNIRAVAALLSSTTGIVDFGKVAGRMAELFLDRGGRIRLQTRVLGGVESEAGVTLHTTAGDLSAGKAVFCGGLHADRLARAFGASVDFRIVPFRGEYFAIRNQPEDLVQHLIYPVPDPARPFLGVHLTRKMDGGFTVGPNAVLAMKREGYRFTDISLRDVADSLSYPGFWKLMRRNAGATAGELAASLFRPLYLRKVNRYCDRIRQQDLVPGRAGVRAQAVAADGRMIDDFVFRRTRHTLHVCNAPSPAATSALPIAEHIADQLLA